MCFSHSLSLSLFRSSFLRSFSRSIHLIVCIYVFFVARHFLWHIFFLLCLSCLPVEMQKNLMEYQPPLSLSLWISHSAFFVCWRNEGRTSGWLIERMRSRDNNKKKKSIAEDADDELQCVCVCAANDALRSFSHKCAPRPCTHTWYLCTM